MFDVGQRVVCIVDAEWVLAVTQVPCTGALPVKGCVYTIRSITAAVVVYGGKVVDLWLELHELSGEYEASAFRPVRNTDISVFTDLLAPTPKELEPA